MADNTLSTPTGSDTPLPDEFLVNISIVSPSVNINSPLKFPGLPPSTTIGQLKAMIRDALDSKPSNEKQRLIHQGKLLVGENDTLLQVLGEQKIRDSDQVIVHLVIREAADQQMSAGQANSPRGQSSARNSHPGAASIFGHFTQANTAHNPTVFGDSLQSTTHGYNHGPHVHQHVQHVRFGRIGPVPTHTPSPLAASFVGQTHPPNIGSMASTAQQQDSLLLEYVNNLQQMQQPDERRQAQQRDAQMRGQGSFGTGVDQAAETQFSFGVNGLGANNPQPHQQPQSYVREGVGPHGEIYRVTVNSTFMTSQGPVQPAVPPSSQPGNTPYGVGGPLSTNDVQNILRNADANQATSMMTNAMQRSAFGTPFSHLNVGNQRQPILTPGVTVPRRPGSAVPLSRTATPDNSRTPSESSSHPNPTSRAAAPSESVPVPEVYILNSPHGPRALLIHGPSEMYFTPMARTVLPSFTSQFSSLPPWPRRMGPGADTAQTAALAPSVVAGSQAVDQAAATQSNTQVNRYQGLPLQQQGQQQGQQQQLAQPQPLVEGAGPMHPVNPAGGLAQVLAAALWPHIWLLIRLTIFVWWFTSSDTSWTRWATIMLLATAVFLFNTGLFNTVAHDWLNPLRQHLEGLLPHVGPERNRNQDNTTRAAGNAISGSGNDNNQATSRQPGELEPAQVAARLVEQNRQRNANWLLDTIRRLERAGLLFLASIAPGVAERHIVTAERAERERQEGVERAEREHREEQEGAALESSAGATGDSEDAGVVVEAGAEAETSQNGSAAQSGSN